MKYLTFLVITLLSLLTACKNLESDVEPAGTYAELESGFQGKVYVAATGKPVAGYQIILQIGGGSNTLTNFNPLTGNYEFAPNPYGYTKISTTDANGNYLLVEKNEKIPVRYGSIFAFASGSSSGYQTYYQEFLKDGVSAPLYNNYFTLEHSKIKNVDVKLHEAHLLTLRLSTGMAEIGEEVRIEGNWSSPVNGESKPFYSSLSLPKPTLSSLPNYSVSASIKTKPNVPVTCVIKHFALDKKLKSTKTITVDMDLKEHIIDVL